LVLATVAVARSNKDRPNKGNKNTGRGFLRRDAQQQSCSSSGRVCAELIDYTNLHFTNNFYVQMSVQVKLEPSKNMAVTDVATGKKVYGKTLQFVLPARHPGGSPSVTHVYTFSAIKGDDFTFGGLGLDDHVGSTKAKIATDVTFRLPFSGTYKVGQGYNGYASHTGKDAFSIDFSMDEGTRVLAAREGVVISTEASNWMSKYDPDVCPKPVNRKCTTPGSDDNNVKVGHSDGTYAEYVHLKSDGVAVSVGDMVNAGQLLGYSGNTGFSKGPHLHISINRAAPWGRKDPSESIRVSYVDINGKKVTPTTGKSYEGAAE